MTVLRRQLFAKHSQINYVSGPTDMDNGFMMVPNLKGSIWRMNDKEFNNSYKVLLSKINTISSGLDNKKCNVFANSNFLVRFFFVDTEYDVFKGLSRLILLFDKANMDLNVFLTIRNHSDIIPSFYLQDGANKILRKLSINSNELIKYLKTGKNNNTEISKMIFNNFKYDRFYNFLSSHLKADKIKFFLYEDFKNNKEKFYFDLSNYLQIDLSETRKLLYGKKDNVTKDKMKYEKLSYLIYNNLRQPKYLFNSFARKLNTLVKLFSEETNFQAKKRIKKSSQLIKNYYREDCLEFEKKHHLGLDRYDYF
jgi:hypothetical protein